MVEIDSAAQLLADSARGFCDLVAEADQLSLQERIAWFSTAFAQLYVAGLQLLPSTNDPEGQPKLQFPDKIDFGSLDGYLKADVSEEGSLSQDVALVYAHIRHGLVLLDSPRRDANEAALAYWSTTFDEEWGRQIAGAMPAFHRATCVFRDDLRRSSAKRQGLKVIDELVTLSTPALEQPKPMLGLRFEPVPGGVEVVAVHPEGPAANVLYAGDFLLSVEGQPLDGLSAEEAGNALVGSVGVPQQIEVFRDGETLTVLLTSVNRTLGPRELKMAIFHPEGAKRAVMALQILGCTTTIAADQLVVVPGPDVAEADVLLLLQAGVEGGVWAFAKQ
ncbi:MAG: DUF5063 domain-containing protein [Proteobacteria bacterium]|jgi:hypothetical protein|nr:DUF5063 domain-containing protein [Pseudomonadota bacterium]